METDIYPLARLEELVDFAAGNKFYVTLDLKDAYHQVELAENSRDLTTFSEDITLYRFTCLPLGFFHHRLCFLGKLLKYLLH